jgi:hypothetical protein
VGFGFELPKVIAPSAPSFSVETPQEMFEEVAEWNAVKLVDVRGSNP